MFAIAFDLTVAEAERRHPRGALEAYRDIGKTLRDFDFKRVQGSVYLTDSEDMANLFRAISALKALPGLQAPFATSARFVSSSGRISPLS